MAGRETGRKKVIIIVKEDAKEIKHIKKEYKSNVNKVAISRWMNG